MLNQSLPSEITTVFETFRCCEFTTLNKQGMSATWPVSAVYFPERGQFLITTSISFPREKTSRFHEELTMEGHAHLPLPHGLRITAIHQDETGFIIKVLSEHTAGRCPLCKEESDSVHSRYVR